MTRTLLSSDKQEIVIGFDAPFCVIGERINPTGRKLLAAEMAAGDYSRVISDRMYGSRSRRQQCWNVSLSIPLTKKNQLS